jgi:hypothetical protein
LPAQRALSQQPAPAIVRFATVIRPFEELAMKEEVLNTSLRKFLKTVGVTSQREIENAIRKAVAERRIKGNEALAAQMVLTIGDVGLNFKIDGTIELE